MSRIASLVCEKCNFRTFRFDMDEKGAYRKALMEMERHADEYHPRSPLYHNYSHTEFWYPHLKEWHR